MLQILPPVFIITGLISVWIPASVVQKGFGEKSGIKGKLIALLIGSVSAGPIYAAFPAALVLFKKGAGVTNIVIMLSSWAVIKIPMLMAETAFMGLLFAITRYLLTLPVILLLGLIVGKFVKREDIAEASENSGSKSIKMIEKELPGINCGACGYENCNAFAEAVFSDKVDLDLCSVKVK